MSQVQMADPHHTEPEPLLMLLIQPDPPEPLPAEDREDVIVSRLSHLMIKESLKKTGYFMTSCKKVGR